MPFTLSVWIASVSVTRHSKLCEKVSKKLENDERLQENINLLEAGKKMKMKGFGDMWYQFHLEKQGAIIKKQTKAMTGRRKQVLR